MATPWFQNPYNSSMPGNLGIYGQAPAAGPVAASVQDPAQAIQIDTTEMRKRKALADTLRGAQKRGVYDYANPLSVTGGANGGPDIVEINYGGILQNALKPYLENRQEEEASAAESAAKEERLARLKEAMGMDMTKQDAFLLGEEFDSDLSGLAKDPREEKLGALRMVAQNPATAGSFLAMGVLTQDEIDAYMAQDAAIKDQERERERADFLWEQQNTYRAPVAGQKLSAEEAKYNLWSQANPGKNYNDYLAAVGGGKQTKAEAGKAAETAEIGGNLAQSAADLRALIESDVDGELFGNMQGFSTVSSNIGEKNAGTLAGEIASLVGGKTENPMTTELRALNLNAVLEQARKLAPVTDTDFAKLMLSKPNAFKTKESALAFVDHLERVAQRYGIPMGGAGAATGLPWSPDLGMTEAQWNKQTPEWQKRFMEAQ